MAEAVADLEEKEFDLLMISVHFDESRMFELMSKCNAVSQNANTPIISICTRDSAFMDAMHDTISGVTKLLGAWTHLDLRRSNLSRKKNAEARRVIERCLLHNVRQPLRDIKRPVQEGVRHLELLAC